VAAQLAAGGHISYVYLGKGFTTAEPAETILVYGPPAPNGGGMLYGDGHAEWAEPALRKYLLSELASGHNPPRR
jgi:prepilin-type processing-associated H-X9-DG protein